MKRIFGILGSVLALVIAVTAGGLPVAQAAFVTVYGGPTYDAATSTGLKDGGILYAPGSGVNNSGTAVGWVRKYESGSYTGDRAVRWDASGTAATELENLGKDSGGTTYAASYAVSDDGTVVGCADKYLNGSSIGTRAVRWDASGTAATELGNLGTSSIGGTKAYAYAVNDAKTAVGYANKYVSGVDKGNRGVRWDASGTAATELGDLGASSSGWSQAIAYAVNDAGTAVGYARKYVSEVDKGNRAVRWDGSGTVATELGNLGTNSTGDTGAYAFDVNDDGTVVGRAEKYDNGTFRGNLAVRWDASGTAATELGNLGMSSSDRTNTCAYAVNGSGTAVGYAEKYDSGNWRGYRAVRWDGSGTVATELGNLGTNSLGNTIAYAFDVNNDGIAVGYADLYIDGSRIGSRAVLWGADGLAIDLNMLIDPNSGWTLTTAKAISGDGLWISGEGTYDPDGVAGAMPAYSRLWTIQVPEPATLSLLALGGLAMLRRRRK